MKKQKKLNITNKGRIVGRPPKIMELIEPFNFRLEVSRKDLFLNLAARATMSQIDFLRYLIDSEDKRMKDKQYKNIQRDKTI